MRDAPVPPTQVIKTGWHWTADALIGDARSQEGIRETKQTTGTVEIE